MAGKSVRSLIEAFRGLSLAAQTSRGTASHRLPPDLVRTMATETYLPDTNLLIDASSPPPQGYYRPDKRVPVTIFDFPSYEPQRLESWSAKHLDLPMRRDILHLAVVYEGDNTRQGTASSKTRWEVHGSHRKLYRQKGTGRARVGNKQSPIRVGGGKAHGPRPRDFGTSLNRKVYDLAWRTALSYRYKKGQLVVCQDGMELPMPDEWDWVRSQVTEVDAYSKEAADLFQKKWLRQVLDYNGWGRKSGRSTFITNKPTKSLAGAMALAPECGVALEASDVDVKDLLETGKIIIEKSALMEMIDSHSSDLEARVFIDGTCMIRKPESGTVIVE